MSSPSSPGGVEGGAYLLIPAGGRGLRMGGGEPKQFRDYGGVPLMKATIQAFFGPDMPRIFGIALAVPQDRIACVRTWEFGVPTWIVAGGDTRQASVAAALAALPGEGNEPVLIHDAVRPFPPALSVCQALDALVGWDGAVLGEPSTDTLKRVDDEGRVLQTEPRERIFRAQTPQVARLSTWKRAFAWAEGSGFAGTDDVSILEAMGLGVKLVLSSSSNFKVTTPEDWSRALERRATECG